MRWVAITVLTRMTPVSDGNPGQRVEIPVSGGRTFRLEDLDARDLASDER